MTPLIAARALTVGYDGRGVASVPALEIRDGDRVLIAGPNGSGKTTVLKTIGRLLAPVAGRLTGVGPGPGGAIYVHPSPFLFVGTGADNVRLGARHATPREKVAAQGLDALGAADLAEVDVREMSNGQRQRVALARAIAARPALLLVDEADSGLDTDGRLAWQRWLDVQQDLAIVRVTHDPDAAAPHEHCYTLDAGVLSRAR